MLTTPFGIKGGKIAEHINSFIFTLIKKYNLNFLYYSIIKEDFAPFDAKGGRERLSSRGDLKDIPDQE